jgi:hypothetical protein
MSHVPASPTQLVPLPLFRLESAQLLKVAHVAGASQQVDVLHVVASPTQLVPLPLFTGVAPLQVKVLHNAGVLQQIATVQVFAFVAASPSLHLTVLPLFRLRSSQLSTPAGVPVKSGSQYNLVSHVRSVVSVSATVSTSSASQVVNAVHA